MIKKLLPRLYLGLVLLFIYAPIIVLIVFSFSSSKFMGTGFGDFTLDWYRQLFQDRTIMTSLYTTLLLATLSAAISTILGTLAAIGIHNMKKWLRGTVENITYIPMLSPDIVMGISMMLLFIFIGVELGFTTLLIAHITFCTPYVIFSVLPKLKQMPEHLYEAALDLGCKPSTAVRRIVLPQIMSGVVTGMLFAFTLSIDDFVVSYFTTSGVPNLSITIYSMAKRGLSPKLNALSALLFVVITLLLIIINVRASRAERKEKARV
ncbi:ABC transporter permease [Eubacteriales bacterium OttesenSCG-928-N14]|nr:ABC transporter permease [Eubacteriales bacterium OttesenSCG-928-N14]